MLLSNCGVCGSKKSIFINEQEAGVLITFLLGIKSPFEGISLLGSIV